MNVDYTQTGHRIRRHRRAQDLTQEQLADLIGMSASFAGHIERGSRKLSVETLCAIADALDLSADYLLGRKPPQPKATTPTWWIRSGLFITVRPNTASPSFCKHSHSCQVAGLFPPNSRHRCNAWSAPA